MGCSASEPEVKEFKKGRPNTSTAPLSMDSISIFDEKQLNPFKHLKYFSLEPEISDKTLTIHYNNHYLNYLQSIQLHNLFYLFL